MTDAITTEIIRHGLLAAAEEMARNLSRTSYNTVVYEIHDYGIGIHDASGDVVADVPGIAAQLIRHATEEHGRIDVLVNNVGAVRMRTEGFFGTSDEDFAWAMQMNFFIALRASRAALAEMVKNGSGA
ncbi:MAG: SDR family NAD(P)-dependent oxidoreductase, partial [Streptosporangiaceae bacterium]|nr:SDR family NAD(P)-dependent oxidoreductase [Streptosporangiaceae bacterium]